MKNISPRHAGQAAKWSFTTEFMAKLIGPVTHIILAHILSPDAFGVVATVTMITSFAEVFSDSGFQKFLIQADFTSEKVRSDNANVAFWSNLMISLFLWGTVYVFRHSIAKLVGNPSLGNAFAIACLSLPLISFSSIQMSLLKRDLDFKTLFFARLAGILVPIFVTVPLAYIMRSFWAMIVGNIVTNLFNAIFLTIRSSWKPRLFYSFRMLKDMFSFCGFASLEQILGWANLNIGIFIVGIYFNSYYIGLYKTSMSMINQIIALFTNSITPVLFSALSRMQFNQKDMNQSFLLTTRLSGLILLPLGVGIFIYRDLVTRIILGNQWSAAAEFIGLWALIRSWRIVFGFYSGSMFMALGKPVYGVFSQVVSLVMLMPVLFIVSPYGFRPLYLSRSLIQIANALVELIMLWTVTRISIKTLLINNSPAIISAILMGCVAKLLLFISLDFLWQIVSIVICVFIYFLVLWLFSSSRKDLGTFIQQLINR